MLHSFILLVTLWVVLRVLIWLFIVVGEKVFNATGSDASGISAGLLAVGIVGVTICYSFGFSLGLVASGVFGVILLGSLGLLVMPGVVLIAAAIGLLTWLMMSDFFR